MATSPLQPRTCPSCHRTPLQPLTNVIAFSSSLSETNLGASSGRHNSPSRPGTAATPLRHLLEQSALSCQTSSPSMSTGTSLHHSPSPGQRTTPLSTAPSSLSPKLPSHFLWDFLSHGSGHHFRSRNPLKRILCDGSSGIFAVTLAVVRMYLGWAYVGNRLLSATVEYEETGWYDGQVWVKTAEILARDRLLGSFTVKPVLSKLKHTLVSLAVSLCLCVVLLLNVDGLTGKASSYRGSDKSIERAIPGVYNDESARSFEPDAFCGESGILGIQDLIYTYTKMLRRLQMVDH